MISREVLENDASLELVVRSVQMITRAYIVMDLNPGSAQVGLGVLTQ